MPQMDYLKIIKNSQNDISKIYKERMERLKNFLGKKIKKYKSTTNRLHLFLISIA